MTSWKATIIQKPKPAGTNCVTISILYFDGEYSSKKQMEKIDSEQFTGFLRINAVSIKGTLADIISKWIKSIKHCSAIHLCILAKSLKGVESFRLWEARCHNWIYRGKTNRREHEGAYVWVKGKDPQRCFSQFNCNSVNNICPSLVNEGHWAESSKQLCWLKHSSLSFTQVVRGSKLSLACCWNA